MANLPEKEKLVRNFNRCANWEEKYLYIIELGAKLPESSESLHQPENVISGCQSQVWIKMTPQADGLDAASYAHAFTRAGSDDSVYSPYRSEPLLS